MADKTEEPKDGGGGGGTNKLLIIVLIVFNLLAVGGIAVLILGAQNDGGDDEAAEEEEEEAAEGGGGVQEGPGQFGPLIEMKPLVANLDDPTAARYVKITLHFEIASETQRPMMEPALVAIRSRLLVYFTGVKLEDTIGKNNKLKIIDDIKALADEVVGEGVVRRVFFTEFVTQ